MSRLVGLRWRNSRTRAESWSPDGKTFHPTTPYEVEEVVRDASEVTAWAPSGPLVVRHAVGDGAVITVLVPRGLGLDERAHPVLPYLMNGLTADLLPVRVEMPDGKRPAGEIQYQVNRTKDGFVVLLMNNRGVDKTQHGVARVDRRQFVDVVVRATLPVKSAKEWTGPRDLALAADAKGMAVKVRVHPGDVQVIGLVTK